MKKCKAPVKRASREVVTLDQIPVAEPKVAEVSTVPPVTEAVRPRPEIDNDFVCTTHNRAATHNKEDGSPCCDPSLGGITMPCEVVWNGTGPAPLPYDPSFILNNEKDAVGFFQCGCVLLLTQDGHWVSGHSFTIAPALIKSGASPTTQCKVYVIIGDNSPRVNAQGGIIIRKPAQIYQAAQVELLALLPPGFMRSQIVQPGKRIIVPG